ncbi:MAG: vitamin B12 dependent methionine synthase [Coriobacteriia bacterium]|nr:vitamin B12 dependent methionine synthase [Coriobacteriia bacterium]
MMVRYGRLGVGGVPEARLDRSEALRYLGYTGQRVDEALLTRFNKLADECERSIKPVFAWSVFDIDEKRTCWEAPEPAATCSLDALDAATDAVENRSAASCVEAECGKELVSRVALEGCDLVLEGNSIAEHLRGAYKVALMACTLGAVSEREMRKHEAISVADGVMFGACCSALVEAAANVTEDLIVRFAKDTGLTTNWRFSPGYGDLPLTAQPAFLRALDASRRLGISVTSTNMLVPVKSVTAVLGLFEKSADGGEARDACAICRLRDGCELRKRGVTCHA